jgi:mannosylglycerate hydrolase
MFPAIPGATHAWAETPFDVVKRAIKVPDSTGWAEPWQGTQPMLNFVDVSDGRAGLALIPRGLCEYEVLEDADRTLALTLLRAYAHRHPRLKNILAPEVKGSQCPGEQTFEYSLYPHPGDWERGQVSRIAYESLIPVAPVQHFGTSLPGERRARFLKISSDKLILHALKKPEKGEGLVVRLGNPTDRAVAADIRCMLRLNRAVLCDMAERPLKPLAVRGHDTVRIRLGPKKVATLRLETSNR